MSYAHLRHPWRSAPRAPGKGRTGIVRTCSRAQAHHGGAIIRGGQGRGKRTHIWAKCGMCVIIYLYVMILYLARNYLIITFFLAYNERGNKCAIVQDGCLQLQINKLRLHNFRTIPHDCTLAQNSGEAAHFLHTFKNKKYGLIY